MNSMLQILGLSAMFICEIVALKNARKKNAAMTVWFMGVALILGVMLF